VYDNSNSVGTKNTALCLRLQRESRAELVSNPSRPIFSQDSVSMVTYTSILLRAQDDTASIGTKTKTLTAGAVRRLVDY
jgi:hypothetical protein